MLRSQLRGRDITVWSIANDSKYRPFPRWSIFLLVDTLSKIDRVLTCLEPIAFTHEYEQTEDKRAQFP